MKQIASRTALSVLLLALLIVLGLAIAKSASFTPPSRKPVSVASLQQQLATKAQATKSAVRQKAPAVASASGTARPQSAAQAPSQPAAVPPATSQTDLPQTGPANLLFIFLASATAAALGHNILQRLKTI